MARPAAPPSDIPTSTVEKFKDGFHLQVLFKNHISGKEEPKATLSSSLFSDGTLMEIKDIFEVKLDDLRSKLKKKLDAKWSFCLDNGAIIDDKTALCYYLTLVDKNKTMLEKPAPPAKDQAPKEPVGLPLLTAFVAVENAMAPTQVKDVSDWASNNKPNLTFTDTSKTDLKAPGVPAGYEAKYAAMDDWKYKSIKPTELGMLDCVVDFALSDWDKLLSINKTLYAFDVRGTKLEVVNARIPTFALCPDSIKKDRFVADFAEICDTPSIEITEVTSEFQSSLVDNAFSARSLETMVGGASPLVSASVSAGIKSESSRGRGSNEGYQKREYHATYNFPRVKLFLDETTLTVSDTCRAALKTLKEQPNMANLLAFQRRFGAFFSKEVTLGGRLQSTKAADSDFKASNTSEREALKASLGAAVSYGPAQVSAQAGLENQSTQAGDKKSVGVRSALSFTARGGDTLLCANPGEWAATVAVWRNWRVIRQDEPVALQALLGQFQEFSWVPGLFEQILGPVKPDDKPAPTPTPTFDANKKWTTNTKLRLWIGDRAWPSKDSWYSVRNGDPSDEGAAPRQTLLADFPLLLFEGDTYERPGQDAPTVWVNDTGVLQPQTDPRGPYRFSLRKTGAKGVWNPMAGQVLANGDKVTLWCHSLGKGGWKSINGSDAPTEAYEAFYNRVGGMVQFETAQATLTAVTDWYEAEFVAEFV